LSVLVLALVAFKEVKVLIFFHFLKDFLVSAHTTPVSWNHASLTKYQLV
jgi:hypothetical protein